MNFCHINEEKLSKPSDRLQISSSVVSRIGSPLMNYIEIENPKQFQLSFIDTESEINPNKLIKNFNEFGLRLSDQNILEELESLKEQLKAINLKLTVTQNKISEVNREAIVNRELYSKEASKIFKEDALCSCNKSCIVF